MQIRNSLTSLVTVVTLGSIVGAASAQSLPARPLDPTLAFQSGHRDTWNTVLVVSSIVGVLGIVGGDGTLAVAGAAGVLLSLYELDQNRFRLATAPRGLELRSGNFVFGAQPLGRQSGATLQFRVRF